MLKLGPVSTSVRRSRSVDRNGGEDRPRDRPDRSTTDGSSNRDRSIRLPEPSISSSRIHSLR
ncbi:hypothetical protein EA472_07140 [Natrarchaeobius oligotrophus]|uniref:Uncharacterized protein n=1 Tax=Natrarchaeobius chitinivorans TaxID=1679083 RepID=A0A3N6MBL3_NATCH|nr:hypothetical protein EA472_07140 [Natrarchaeobius chitinivorans]